MEPGNQLLSFSIQQVWLVWVYPSKKTETKPAASEELVKVWNMIKIVSKAASYAWMNLKNSLP